MISFVLEFSQMDLYLFNYFIGFSWKLCTLAPGRSRPCTGPVPVPEIIAGAGAGAWDIPTF